MIKLWRKFIFLTTSTVTVTFFLFNLELHLHPWSHWQLAFPSYDFESLSIQIDNPIPFFQFVGNREVTEVPEQISYPDTMTALEIMDDLLRSSIWKKFVDKFLNLLTDSCRTRLTIRRNVCKNCKEDNSCPIQHAKVGIPFSGGLDSTVVAFLADKFVPENEPIDLLNVAFDRQGSFDVPDRQTGLMSANELRVLCPNRVWNFVEVSIYCWGGGSELRENC